MSFKSFFNVLSLNICLIYITVSHTTDTPSDYTLKILLYSYFFRSLYNLLVNEFVQKLFHHDITIFSCFNIFTFLTIAALNILMNYAVLMLCFENNFLMSIFSSFLLAYCHLFWQKINNFQGNNTKKFLLFVLICGFIAVLGFFTESYKNAVLVGTLVVAYFLSEHLLWKASIKTFIEANEINAFGNFYSVLLMLFYFVYQIIIEKHDIPLNEDLPQPISSYIYFTLSIFVYSFNLKHGEGYFHFEKSSYFSNINTETYVVTLILCFITITYKLSILTIKTLFFSPVFLMVWVIFSLVNWCLIRHFISSDIENLPVNTSNEILPLSVEPSQHDTITYSLSGLAKVIRTDKNSKKIFIMLIINFTFMFVEFIYGVLGNSLSLISDSAHMMFDSSALAIGLYASFMSKLKPDSYYTYGYARFQVLSGFINGVFLMFVAFSIFNEALERIIEPPVVNSRQIILVSVIGFAINIFGLCNFHEHSHFIEHYENEVVSVEEITKGSLVTHNKREDKQESHKDHHEKHQHDEHNHDKYNHDEHNHDEHHEHEHEHEHEHNHEEHNHEEHHHNDEHEHDEHHHHEHEHDVHDEHDEHEHHHHHDHHNENLYGVFLHIAADTLGSVGVITSLVLIELFQWYIADAIASFVISLMITASIIPLIKSSAEVLLQSYPKKFEKKLKKMMENIIKLSEVTALKEINLWAYTSNSLVCTVCVNVKKDSDDEKVKHKIRKIMKNFPQINHSTIQLQYDS